MAGESAGPLGHAKLLDATEVELIFTRANQVSKRRAPEEVLAEERGIKAAIEALGLTNAVEEKEFDDGGSARMVLSEFVCALVPPPLLEPSHASTDRSIVRHVVTGACRVARVPARVPYGGCGRRHRQPGGRRP